MVVYPLIPRLGRRRQEISVGSRSAILHWEFRVSPQSPKTSGPVPKEGDEREREKRRKDSWLNGGRVVVDAIYTQGPVSIILHYSCVNTIVRLCMHFEL